jgi:hypothetical protein
VHLFLFNHERYWTWPLHLKAPVVHLVNDLIATIPLPTYGHVLVENLADPEAGEVFMIQLQPISKTPLQYAPGNLNSRIVRSKVRRLPRQPEGYMYGVDLLLNGFDQDFKAVMAQWAPPSAWGV